MPAAPAGTGRRRSAIVDWAGRSRNVASGASSLKRSRSVFLGAAVLGLGGLAACSNSDQERAAARRNDGEPAPAVDSGTKSLIDAAKSRAEEVVAPRLVLDLPPDLFKDAWREPVVTIAIPIREPDRPDWEHVFASELQKYRRELFYDKFAAYACARLQFDDVPVGGTFWWRGVIVSVETKNPAIALHHEMASWLFYRYSGYFDKTAWLQANPLGFQYSGRAMATARSVLEGRRLDAIEDDQLASGFLNHYCRVSLDNDFSEIAAQLFLNEPRFWNAVDRHGALAQKVRLAIKFYEQVDSRYSEEYFRGLASTQAALDEK